ncbi:MAG: hypothetical protein QQN57_08095, partial [Nitrosopumilus sp.]
MLIISIKEEKLEKVKEKFNKKYRYTSFILKNIFKIKCKCSRWNYDNFDEMINQGIVKQRNAHYDSSIKINKC